MKNGTALAKDSFISVRKFGIYTVHRRIGSGANSAIFEVTDPQGRPFALKRVVKRMVSDDRFFTQAENEFETGQKIDHPVIRKLHNLVRIRSFLRLRELHLLMEMVYGQTVEALRPKDMLTVASIFRQVAAGLHAMHEAGFAHADIKPNNILVGPQGQVKIIDLGQSCPLGTIKQRIQGTPDYIAPEQVHRRPIDQRTDVFNVGASLYWLLTGQHLPTVLPKLQPGREIALVAKTSVMPPSQINPQVPAALSRLAMDCVSVSPADRPADMRIVATRLETIEVILKKEPGRPAGQPQGQPNPPAPHDWTQGPPIGTDADGDTVDLPADIDMDIDIE